jgi:hypothetical protein
MSMATDGVNRFLRAEEEAHCLVDELTRLKEETKSYKTAHEALGDAAAGVGELSTRCANIAEKLGGLAETLRSIGTPGLLHGLEAVAKEVGVLRQDLGGARQSIIEAHRRDVERIKEDLSAQLSGARAAVRAVRNLALGSAALLVIALIVLGWLALSLARG